MRQTISALHGAAIACVSSIAQPPRFFQRLFLLLLVPLFVLSWGELSGQATVTSDKPDYAPRSNAVFTGSGFLPGEQVQLKVKNLFRACNTVSSDSSYLPWTVTADASGGFVTNWTVCDCVGDSLRLKATGQTSGLIAYAYFTDANDLTSFASDCITAKTTFCLGATVCMKSTTINGGNHHIEWFKPSGAISVHNSGTSNTSISDSYVPDVAGTWTIKLIKESNGNVDNTITITINPSPNPPTAVNYLGAYDGASHIGSATVGGGQVVDWFANATGNTAAAAPSGTNVGIYTAYAEARNLTGGCVSSSRTPVTVTITKADPSISVTGYSGVYTGTAHGATGTATGVGGVNLGSLLHVASTTYTNVPGGLVHWTFDGDDNYNATSGDAMVTITKADPTISVTGYDVPYDATAHTATGTATGVLAEALAGLDLSGTTHTTGGTYTDSWSFTDVTGNYNDKSGTVSDKISKVNASISVTGYSGVYTGTAHGATGTATGVGGVNLGSLLHVASTTYTNVPGGLVHWTFDGDDNYNAASEDAMVTIGKANPSITVTGYSVTYNGLPHTATYAINGVNGESGATVGTIDVSGTTHTDAGTYLADAWSFTGAANYNNTSGTVNNAIGKANPSITVTGYSVTYDGLPHTATYAINGVNGESGATVGTIDVSGTTHTDAGTYLADAWSFTGAANYNNTSGTVNNAIGKANPSITVTGYSVTYNGLPHTATYAINGVNGESGATVGTIDVSATTHTDAGTYLADAWSFTGAANYNNTSGTVNNAIAKAPTSISITFGNLLYDGNPKVGLATVTGAGGLSQGLTVTYVGTGATSYGPTTTAPNLVGTYSASASYAETANYLASNKTENFTILAASTNTTLTLSAASVRYMDNLTMTAVIVPVNTGSPLTGAVTFKINGVVYGSATVVPIPGASDGSVQAQLIKQVAEMPNVPNTGTYPVVAEFVSTNANYSGSSNTKQLNVRQRNADPFIATGFYTGDLFAWTTGPNTSTATLTLAASFKDANIPPGDMRAAKATFYFVNGSSLIPIPSAQNLPVGLIDASDGSAGFASAIVQLNIGSQNSTSFQIAVGLSGAYTNTPGNALSQAIVTVSKPVTGGFITGGGCVPNTGAAGLIKGAADQRTGYQFDIQYTKSGTNPKGKVNIMVKSYFNKDGLLDSKLHTYLISTNSIALLNVGTPLATGTFSAKANLVEQMEDLSIVAIEGGATFQMTAFQNACDQKLAMVLYRKAGGIWMATNWSAANSKSDLLAVTSKSTVYVAGGGNCNAAPIVANAQTTTSVAKLVNTEEVNYTELDIRIQNNPSSGTSAFQLQLRSNDKVTPINLRVLNANGKPIESREKLSTGNTVEMGRLWIQGLYFVEVIQGQQRKVLKLLKQ
ncbi:MAG TPA: T9SS type A sorting domain-containing protein [Phnomibacter sp.]|nr:T9SS type A sorting domain-containing protein [Phnomibacter sp.]